MDLSGNPWNFVAADQATTFLITAIVRNGLASATVTTNGIHTLVAGQNISLQGNTPSGWNGGYQILSVPSTTTFLIPIPPQLSTLANATGFGSVYTAAYMQEVEVTQMLWDSPTATGVLSLTDLVGRTVWNPTAVTGGTLTYAKVFPIMGLVIKAMPSGTLQISV